MASPNRFLVRTWLPGKGCVYVRSTALTEAEARDLHDASADAIELAQESGKIEKVNLKQGFAFVKALRSPDPDRPGRTAPGFVLLSVPDPPAFLRDAVASEFAELLSFAANQALDSVPPFVQASDLDRRGVKMLDLGGTPPPSGSESRPPRRNQWQVGVMAAGLVLLALFSLRWMLPNVTSPSNSSTPASATQLVGAIDPQQQDWDRSQEQILKLLRESWAEKLLGENTSPQATGTVLLSRFTRLFEQPDLKATLTEKSFNYYELKAANDHPFRAFLDRLPKSISVKLPDEVEFSPTAAMNYLKELRDKLKPSGIDLDLSSSDRLSDQARLSLDYDIFFPQWRSNPKSAERPTEKWDTGREFEGADQKWVAEVRELIKERYPQH